MPYVEPHDATQTIGDPPPTDAGADDERPADEEAQAEPAPERPPTVGQLRRERKRLWDERQETVFHIGGLAMELESRGRLDDHLVRHRVQVVQGLDGRITEIDAQLAEIDTRRRRGRERTPEPVGYCMSCGAPHQADAAFCFRCGSRILPPGDDADDTQVIDTGTA